MSELVRKQVYIHHRQESQLKRMARLGGISEAEVIRRAIDYQAEHTPPDAVAYDHSAWEEILMLIEERRKLGTTSQPYRWNRHEIYANRENRWLRDRPEEEGDRERDTD